MRKLISFTIVLILYSCSNKSSEKCIKVIDALSDAQSEIVCHLDENIDFLGKNINDLDFIDDSTFVISNDDNIYIYDIGGRQIRSIGRVGRAKGEYISAGALYVYDGILYVQCRKSLKIIAYDCITGNVVDEYKHIDKNARDFVVMNNFIYLYGNGDLNYIKIYDISNKKMVSSFKKYNDVDELLFFNSLTRGISCSKEEVIFSVPSTFSIYKAGLNSVDLICNIRHSAYVVNDKIDAKKIMLPPFDEAIDYTNNNSTIVAINSYDNNIYVVAENKDLTSKNKFVNKNITVYVIDVESNDASCATITYPTDAIISRYYLYKNALYYIGTDFDGNRYIAQTTIQSE